MTARTILSSGAKANSGDFDDALTDASACKGEPESPGPASRGKPPNAVGLWRTIIVEGEMASTRKPAPKCCDVRRSEAFGTELWQTAGSAERDPLRDLQQIDGDWSQIDRLETGNPY